MASRELILGCTDRSAGDMTHEAALSTVLGRLGLDVSRAVGMEQVHGRRVRAVCVPEAGDRLARTDGLVTREPGLPLVALSGDCPLVCLYDAREPAVAVLHAGWRGLAAGVLQEGLRVLAPTRPDQVAAYIAPHAGPCCYEVGEEVAARFPAGAVRRKPGQSRPHLDLAAAAEEALGLPLRPIEAGCTICGDRWFSHRKTGTTSRQALIAALRPFPTGILEPRERARV